MSAVLDNIVPFAIPKQPRIKQQEPLPDQRKVVIIPFKAIFDKELTHGALTALAALCAYCNRAGITWVSQARLSAELGISQQALSKQFKQLRERGYLMTIRKGYMRERTDTLRVIYDPAVDTETAIAITSRFEDTRPPVMKMDQQEEEDRQDPEGQRRLAEMIKNAFTDQPKRSEPMTKETDTRAVKEVKEAMRKAQTRRSRVVDKSVDKSIHAEPLIQPEGCEPHNSRVVLNQSLTNKKSINISSLYKFNTVLNNLEFKQLVDEGITHEQIAQSLETLLPLYQAEGIEPASTALMAGIRQLQADAR
jgi:biotin operon repressor